MKKYVFVVACLIVFGNHNLFSQDGKEKSRLHNDTVSVDSIEYRLIIFDPGFDAWLAAQPSKQFYSKEYYEQRNRIYVLEWNHRYISDMGNNKYETYIEYNPNIDYGLDLNYRLYYYFRYFEETNKVKLYPSGKM